MKTNNEIMRNNILSLAVQGALIAMFAMPLLGYAADAADDETAALTHPSNSIEIGATSVSRDSAKFGEYNGLDENGLYGIANINLRGGNAYEEGDGTTRWEIKGVDLGTTSRSLSGSASSQGQWNIGIGYDELQHNITDTYQTPQQGNMGGNNFTFPAAFGAFNAQSNPSARVLTPTQLGAFHTEKIHTDRKNTSFEAGYTFSQELSMQFDYNHLDQDGAKLIGIAAIGAPATTGTWRAEGIGIIMNPTNYKTDSFNLALNWHGEKGHLTGGYYGSIFRDGYDSLSAQNAMLSNSSSASAGLYQTNTLSTAPDNSLHQFNLSGGYAFSSATKLTGGFSYGRNTQDNSYLSGQQEISLAPRSSLDGKVITTHADLKLTHQTGRDLGLSAGFKYNERDNQSPSNLYRFYAINNRTTVDAATNAPYSNRKVQVELAADYRLTKGQNVRVAYEHEAVKRWCNNYGIAGVNCLVNPSNDEDRLSINYRIKAREGVNFNAGYAYAKRRADFQGNAITPLSGLDLPNGGHDVNAQNYPGYIAYPYAKRDQQMVKAGVNWQATEKLDIGLNGRYAHDIYDANLGVQDGNAASVNLDATYSYSEKSSVSAYVSWQNSERELKAGAAGGTPAANNVGTSYAALVAPVNIWTNQLKDTSRAIGLNTKHSGLMGGKLEILGDLSYSLDKSGYSTQVPYDATCGASTKLICGSTPDIRTQLITLKLNGNYQVDKHGKVALGYIYQHLNSDDFFYNTYQYGYTPNRVMPTNQDSGSYSVNVVTATYIYTF